MTICFACVEYFTLTAFSDRQLQLQDLEVRSSCPTQPKDSRVCLKLPLQRPTSLIHERLQNNFRAHNTLIFHSESTSDAHEGQQQTNMHQTLTYNILQTMWRGCFSAAQSPTSLSTHLHMQLHMQELLISSVFQSENLLNSSSNFTQLA